ncbi:Pyridoxine/pyridoxamine 5'-phosphate oxidase 1 [Citrus sinensis]|nr:Pyridoxine/pyridoxamine 5'-phosphate oxidase 1 [Citrus sinensis]
MSMTCSLLAQSLTLAYHYNTSPAIKSTCNPFSPLVSNQSSSSSVFLRPVSAPAIRAFCSKSDAMSSAQNSDSVSHLTQREAAEIDETLMGPLGFSVDQLMELAGLSVATSIAEAYKASEYDRVLAICGPGNNGGDGLVAARQLYHFGYKPFVCYPKRTQKPLYTGLVTQLESLSIPFLSVEDLPLDFSKDFDIIVDAMFGFSFHGTPRPPFDDLIKRLLCLHGYDQTRQKRPVIVSVDIPSGWHVEEGDIGDEGIKPDMLVSLTAPKLCAKKFSGPHHFLGGRFVPPVIAHKYKLRLPPYPGTSMCVRIGKAPSVDISALRENYISPEFLEEQVESDPINQFRKWFDDAIAAGLREPNAMALSTVGKDGKPSSRMVLLKGVDRDGFVWSVMYFYYNGNAAIKSVFGQMFSSPMLQSFLNAGINISPISFVPSVNIPRSFWYSTSTGQVKSWCKRWLPVAVETSIFTYQSTTVRVEGSVEKVSDEESEQYFHSRPRGSQIGAIVSKQSSVIPGRHVLYQQYKELEEKFSDWSLIPKPEFWGGYRLKPELFEFWQGQTSRLHDRLQYSPQEINGKR